MLLESETQTNRIGELIRDDGRKTSEMSNCDI